VTLTTGQKLWLVPARRRGKPREVEVGKVGRKWAALIPYYEGRVDIETLALDGGNYTSPGRCYGSRAEWEESSALGKAWAQFHRDLGYEPNPGVTAEDLAKVRELLRMPPSPPIVE